MENRVTVLLRLVNNDRIIGQYVPQDINKSVIIIYAPLIIKNDDYTQITKYDSLSDAPLATFNMRHILTMNSPNDLLESLYEDIWDGFYTSYEEYKAKLMEKYPIDDSAEDIFSEFKSDKIPVKKTLN